MITVLCADDNTDIAELMQVALNRQPDMRCAGTVTDAAELPKAVAKLKPDVLVMDLRMPGINALQFVRQLQTAQPQTRVIVYSGYDDRETIDNAIEAGAWGFVSKHQDLNSLLEAVRKVARGEMEAR
jgi:DNA-binding NarL/FixJ family response regulator